MKISKVLHRSQLPVKLPIYPTIVCLLALDYWKAPLWLVGAVGMLLVIAWIAAIILLIVEEQVKIKL